MVSVGIWDLPHLEFGIFPIPVPGRFSRHPGTFPGKVGNSRSRNPGNSKGAAAAFPPGSVPMETGNTSQGNSTTFGVKPGMVGVGTGNGFR